MKRAGFSLIELVLAIVIIAISVMTIPLMLSQSSNNDSFSIMQESILAARTKMGNILSYEWDKNSVDRNGSITYIRVLDVNNGDSELDRNETTLDKNRRLGHIEQDFRRRFHEGNETNKTFPSTDSLDINKTSINSFNTEVLGNTMDGNPSEFDYVIRDFNMSTNIYYISDEADYDDASLNFDFNITSNADITNVNNSTNVKMIEIFVQSKSTQPFRFRAFSSNIGQTELLELDTGDL
jgi:prepilin-type N-terminal cleavage/methylation domain-containing protein